MILYFESLTYFDDYYVKRTHFTVSCPSTCSKLIDFVAKIPQMFEYRQGILNLIKEMILLWKQRFTQMAKYAIGKSNLKWREEKKGFFFYYNPNLWLFISHFGLSSSITIMFISIININKSLHSLNPIQSAAYICFFWGSSNGSMLISSCVWIIKWIIIQKKWN